MIKKRLVIVVTFALLVIIPDCFGGTSSFDQYDLFTSRIVGGSEVLHGIYPFFVRVFQGGKFRCGGTVIDPQWVVTAAHCFQNKRDKVEIYMEQTTQKMYEADKFWIHDDFLFQENPRGKKEGGVFNDIALIRLKVPIDHASPLYLNLDHNWPQKEEDTLSLTVIGVGDTDPDPDKKQSPEKLLKTSMAVYPMDDCISAYSTYLKIHSEQMICAHDPNTSPCNGDSGGPLFDEKRRLLVGIVSFGEPYRGAGCYSAYPAVFVRISNYIDWIQDIRHQYQDATRAQNHVLPSPKSFDYYTETTATSSSSSVLCSLSFVVLIISISSITFL